MIKPEEQFILSGARIEPLQPDIDRMNGLISKISDWNYLAILAINNGMAPLVSKKIPLLEKNHLIPPEIKEQLHQAYLKTPALPCNDTFEFLKINNPVTL